MTTPGAKGILITPGDSKAIVPAIQKARDAGVLVIALDTPTEPQSAADALFATDNFKAGLLIGEYAKAKAKELGTRRRSPRSTSRPGISVGVLRHNGFLKGFGIKRGRPATIVGVRATRDGDDRQGPDGHGELPPEGSRHQRRLHDQRADGVRRVQRAEGGRQGRKTS